MIDRPAIEKIEEMAHAAAKVACTEFPVKALPSGVELVDLERFQGERNRFRGTMSTTSIEDFLRYTNTRKADACFINAEKMSATAFFNMGDAESPGHCDDKAVLTLTETAPYRAVTKIDGTRSGQKEIAEWLEDWRDHLLAIAQDGSNMDIKKAIAAVRRVTIEAKRAEDHEDRDFGAKRTAMEEIDAKGKDVDLPRSFEFHCIPYECLASRPFLMRLSLITAPGAPVFTMRIIQLETIKEEIAQEFRDKLLDGFEDNIKAYIGSFAP